MIKVSIIVPICNVDKYLEKCLESIRLQTLKDIEVICIDDGSTDTSREIAQKFVDADSRFKLIAKPNAGYGHTMNVGLSNVTGEYVGIIESDDFIDLKMFESLYAKAIEGDFEVVKSDYFLYWSNPEIIIPSHSLNQKNVFDITPSIWTAIYKRTFLEQNCIKFLETPGASFQDTGFSFKIWSRAKKYYLFPKNFVYYRQDNANSSVKSSSKVFNICEEFEELERFLKIQDANFIRRRAICFLWNYRRLGKEGRNEFFRVLHSVSRNLFSNGEYINAGFTFKQIVVLWLAAYLPFIFKFVVNAADE